jgi:RHS repeat-associated protein
VKYSYDALNRVVSETDVVGGTPYTVSYGYDLAGDAQSVTYPDGTKVSYSFDALGRTTKAASGPTTYATVAYNPDGTVSAMTYGNGEVTSYSYDSMSRPKSITTAQGSNQLLSLSYKYDGAGNVVSINSESFGYDALDRLNGATGPWGAATYSYDPAGNLVQKQNSSSPTTRYTYNSMDELVRSSTAGGATTYSYNGDGDLVVKNDGTNIWTYVYNTQDQMTKVLENGVVVQQNYYDGEGRRVEQTTGTTTMLYLYVGLNALYEKNLQTGAATKHVYADGEQIASIATAGTFFLAADELGSTRLVTSGSSQVFSSDYVPYGVEHGASGSEEYMYTGMLYDAATGLYYDNARFYDPSTGKFLTADPVGGGKSDPQSLNAYAYARDNPLAIVDPSGLSWKPLTVLLGVAVAGLIAIDAAQGGFDVLTDGITVEAISELVGSATVVGASAVGLPVVLGGTEDIGPDALAAATSSWTDRWDSGDAGEVYLQGIVQRVGLNTERGWYMNSETGELAKLSGVQTGWVQLDLYDFEHGWAFESKVGYRGYTDYEDDQARAQAALVKRGFLNGVSWFSLPNDEGSTGFSQHLWRDTLLPRGIISGFWTDGVGMTFYKWPY